VRPGLPEPTIAKTKDASAKPNRSQQAAAH